MGSFEFVQIGILLRAWKLSRESVGKNQIFALILWHLRIFLSHTFLFFLLSEIVMFSFKKLCDVFSCYNLVHQVPPVYTVAEA